MKKIIAGIAVLSFLGQSFIASAATVDNCRQFAYGYMTDGKVYMMLAGKKYGPFEDTEQLKFTIERMGPQFKENLRQYMLYEPNGGPEKYLVFRSELGECNPYTLDMTVIAEWNTKVTNLFQTLNLRFANNIPAYRTALTNAINILQSKIDNKQGSQKTLEILKLVRDRFIVKLKTL